MSKIDSCTRMIIGSFEFKFHNASAAGARDECDLLVGVRGGLLGFYSVIKPVAW